MNKLAKMALTLAAAGSVCYLFKDKIKTTKAYQTVEKNDTVKKAKATATDTYHKVKDSETVKKIKKHSLDVKGKTADIRELQEIIRQQSELAALNITLD